MRNYTEEQIKLLNEANEKANQIAKELYKYEQDFQNNLISEKELIKKYHDVYSILTNNWLNKEDSESRFPSYFEDLEIQEILKPFFKDIFGDF